MDHRAIEKNGIFYIEGVIGKTQISTERDALDFIVHCGEYDTNRILLYEENFSEVFFDLKTDLAGAILQKLATYNVKAAFLISDKHVKGRFGEMVAELRKSREIRFFTNEGEAGDWLISN